MALVAAVPGLPGAAATHECTYQYFDAFGVEAFACIDSEGRVHNVFVKDETLGGVAASHPFFSEGHEFWGGEFQYTDVLVYTYGRSPAGQTWVHPFNWCIDNDGDDFCDDTWVGASTNVRGFFNQVHLDHQPGGAWYYCALTSVGWWCDELPVQPPIPGLPVMPTLP